MELVVDANILFLFFKAESYTRKLLESLYLRGVRLYIPDFELDELLSLKTKICKYGKIDEDEFITSFILLLEIFEVIPKPQYEVFMPKAEKLLPGHTKDMPHFALALSSGCAIWSNEKRFKEQPEVEILSTDDIKKFFDVE